jgi:hypothetical protein
MTTTLSFADNLQGFLKLIVSKRARWPRITCEAPTLLGDSQFRTFAILVVLAGPDFEPVLMTDQEIGQLVGLTESTVHYQLREIQEAGLIHRGTDAVRSILFAPPVEEDPYGEVVNQDQVDRPHWDWEIVLRQIQRQWTEGRLS